MQEKAAREYLEALGELFKDRVTDMEIIDYEQGPALIISAPAPFNSKRTVAYTISLKEAGDNYILFELMITVFCGIPDELFPDVAAILNALNNGTVIGSFLLFKKGNAVLYKHGLIFDGNADVNSTSDNMLHTLSLMENSAVNGAVMLEEYFSGNKTSDDIISLIKETGGVSL